MNFENVYDNVYVRREDRGIGEKEFLLAHRIQMSLKIGRELTPNETVHHLDGDKQNNSFENLFLFHTKSDHTQYHNYIKLGIAPTIVQIEDGSHICIDTRRLRYCKVCGKRIFVNKNRICRECSIANQGLKHRHDIPSYTDLLMEVKKGLSCLDLAKKYNTSYQTIRRRIRKKVV